MLYVINTVQRFKQGRDVVVVSLYSSFKGALWKHIVHVSIIDIYLIPEVLKIFKGLSWKFTTGSMHYIFMYDYESDVRDSCHT